MVHRKRSPMAKSRIYRMIHDREHLVVYDRNKNKIGQVRDCPRAQLNRSESASVMELNLQGQTYLMPVVECEKVKYVPTTKMILQDESGGCWEIRNVQVTDDQIFYRCLCTERITDS